MHYSLQYQCYRGIYTFSARTFKLSEQNWKLGNIYVASRALRNVEPIISHPNISHFYFTSRDRNITVLTAIPY